MARSPFIRITPDLSLDERELEFSFIRAGGPGGQNVNKVATAVQLRFDALGSRSLPASMHRRLLVLAGKRATADGVIVISASRFRTQERNRADAIERLVELVRRAAVVPRKRKPTRPTKAARTRRLESKRRRSDVKSKRTMRRGDLD
ncbi:MAG: alternative ribosome rescue aminoacyl-tRNA hydrolase ArfB [Rhodospirillaceae bacterium]